MEGPVRKIPLAELKTQVGNEVGSSEWMPITQQMIDSFADLTGDHYFIHVNPTRAAAETPFGGSIAHGFLTLSMLAQMAYQACPSIQETKTGVNYGFNKVRFISPVLAGKRVARPLPAEGPEHRHAGSLDEHLRGHGGDRGRGTSRRWSRSGWGLASCEACACGPARQAAVTGAMAAPVGPAGRLPCAARLGLARRNSLRAPVRAPLGQGAAS